MYVTDNLDFFHDKHWMIATRTITAATNWRTVIAPIIPHSGMMHSFSAIYLTVEDKFKSVFPAMLNSFIWIIVRD